ncbi:MAG: glycosyltransferase family 39 protein [Propionibacteriaceae bacterium]
MTEVAREAPVAAVSDRARLRWQEAVTLFVVGFGCSFVLSWRPSLWTDEAATISAATRTLPQLVAMARNIDAVHATYYAFMHGWLLVFPAEALWLRLPSGVAVGLTAVLTYTLGLRLTGRRVALAGALVFVVLPRTTWMGMEARSSAFSALLAVAATLVLLLWLDPARTCRQRRLCAVAYALLAGLGIAINIYLALGLVAHGISVLLARQVPWRRRFAWLAAGICGVLLATPVIWNALHQTGQLGGGPFGLTTWLRNVIVNQWFLGETPTLSTGAAATGGPLTALWKIGSVALALVCWLLVALGVLIRRRSPAVLIWCLPWIAVPTLVIGLYSLGVENLYNARYFAYATPGLALLIGQGLMALSRSWQRVAAAIACLVFLAPVYVSQRTLYAKSSTDWSAIAAFVDTRRGADQAVYFSPRNPITGPLVGQTARGVQTAYPHAFEGLRDVTLLRTPVEDNNLTGTSRVLADSVSQLDGMTAVWVIRRNDYAYAAADDATLLAAGFVPGQSWDGPLDRVIEFERR